MVKFHFCGYFLPIFNGGANLPSALCNSYSPEQLALGNRKLYFIYILLRDWADFPYCRLFSIANIYEICIFSIFFDKYINIYIYLRIHILIYIYIYVFIYYFFNLCSSRPMHMHTFILTLFLNLPHGRPLDLLRGWLVS